MAEVKTRATTASVNLHLGEKGAAVLFKALGPHTLAKVCLHLKRLADVQLPVLEQLVALSVAGITRRYPPR